MTRYEYNKTMSELARKMYRLKKNVQGEKVADFFLKAAEGFEDRLSKMGAKLAALPVGIQEIKNYKHFKERVEEEERNQAD